MAALPADSKGENVRQWILKDKFATAGIVKMAGKTFKEFAANLEELIANAYDDDATSLEIVLEYETKNLTVKDNGNGMDEEQLKSYVCYGESRKTKGYRSPKFCRAPIGEFGMGGKLAITNLSRKCRVITQKSGWMHTFDMDSSLYQQNRYLSDIRRPVKTVKTHDPSDHGTELHMKDLRYFPRSVDTLRERLSMKMPLSQNFRIFLELIRDGERERIEIQEEVPQQVEKHFSFEEDLKLVGPVKLEVYYTVNPVPAIRQGIWTKVNGRIVNERQEWFGLEKLTSGNKYRWRLSGFAFADGLKDSVNFAKNDFIDSPEYREYWRWIHEQLKKVQAELLKADDEIAREKERNVIKHVEHKVNEWVAKLNLAAQQLAVEEKIRKVRTEKLEDEPEESIPAERFEADSASDNHEGGRGPDKEPRRNQSASTGTKYKGRTYRIEPVDMGHQGDLVRLDRELALIEVNERHALYEVALKNDHLSILTRDVALTEIARDISNGDFIAFEAIYNELAKIAGESV